MTDYLLKPIRFERFVRAVNKVHTQTAQNQSTPTADLPTGGINFNENQGITPMEPVVWVNVNKKRIRLILRDILFVESLKDYTRVHLLDQRIDVHTPLNKLEQLLPPDEFIRINRSYVVRCDAVTSVQSKTLGLTNNAQLAIGITYRDSVREQFM